LQQVRPELIHEISEWCGVAPGWRNVMLNEDQDEFTRSPLDFWHFAIVVAGFFVTAGGVTVSSVSVVLLGHILAGWGLAYFFFNGSEDRTG